MLIKNNSVSSEYVCLYDFFKNKNIGIPIFQRFYDWKPKQLEELCKDILFAVNEENKTIYLLDFIYYLEDNKIKIADGQQRLVTINIFFKAINDVIEANKLNIPFEPLFNISYDVSLNNEKYNTSFFNYPIAPFKKVYLYIKEFVESNISIIDKVINVLKKRIYIYIKKCESADDAFLIFQQINTGGKPLSKDEIIKTSIDQYAKVYDVLIKSDIKEMKTMVNSYYKYILSTSNVNFDNIAIMSFLKDYVVKSKETFLNFINALTTVSNCKNTAISYVIKYINRSQLLDVLNVLSMKGINIENKKEYLVNVMAPLCLLSVCMSMKKSNPGGIIKVLYSDVINMIKENRSSKDISYAIVKFINENATLCKISFNDFKDSLGDKNLSFGIKKGLLILDVILRSTSSKIIVENINLEHIYPQNPSIDWALYGWPSDRESQLDLISNIGNFLLLNEEVNKTIQNKYITQKVDFYKRIIPNDISLQSKMNTVDFASFENKKKDYIKKRQADIAKIIQDTFPIGKVLIY